MGGDLYGILEVVFVYYLGSHVLFIVPIHHLNIPRFFLQRQLSNEYLSGKQS